MTAENHKQLEEKADEEKKIVRSDAKHLFVFITTLAFIYLFANISNCIGLDVKKQKITNHSSRCTAVSNMTRIDIQEQELIKITGHSCASSLKPYLQINEEHHSEILS
ncbi:hypothetical protein ANN_20105 [Periplaneta americana]|uniref:Uncharacterized protein n=1 Tax=Periplaneta americana TaxID=6978 RepID=A0ABQ8SC36_PERAM|nr:hypothetical protein ANN_20105 [Periplaneta americana]